MLPKRRMSAVHQLPLPQRTNLRRESCFKIEKTATLFAAAQVGAMRAGAADVEAFLLGFLVGVFGGTQEVGYWHFKTVYPPPLSRVQRLEKVL